MLNVECPALHLITTARDNDCYCTRLQFAADSQSYLVAWVDDDEEPGETSVEVYRSQDGGLLSSFDDSACCLDPTYLLLPDSRVVIAETASFKVLDLSSGQLLATARPESDSTYPEPDYAGQLATSRSGTQLAFCPVPGMERSLKIYVYDASTLQPLACLDIGAKGAVSMDLGTRDSHGSGLFWSLHGWMLAYTPSSCQSQEYQYGHPYGHLQVMASQAGSSVCQHAAMQGCEPRQPPALSPCSSFVLLFERQSATLEIRDVRSGKLMVSRTVWPGRDARAEHDLLYGIALRWSSCGSRVVAVVRAMEKELAPNCVISERIVVMHLI